MENYIITNPQTADDFSKLHILLQTELRKELECNYDIEEEYPLVLGPTNKHRSFILKLENEIIAHANLIIKAVIDSKTGKKFNIALIGNVCTHRDFQSKGWIRKLLQHLENQTNNLNCVGIWLWSDKKEIYEKLGYHPLGRELRITFSKESFQNNSLNENIETLTLKQLNPQDLKLSDYQKLIKLKPRTRYEIERSVEDYQKLIKIPDTQLLVLLEKNANIKAFILVGRGMDFKGVIHEWGMENVDYLRKLLEKLFIEWEVNEIILLSPLEIKYQESFKVFNIPKNKIEEFPCALVKKNPQPLPHPSISLDEIFVWGMDSI